MILPKMMLRATAQTAKNGILFLFTVTAVMSLSWQYAYHLSHYLYILQTAFLGFPCSLTLCKITEKFHSFFLKDHSLLNSLIPSAYNIVLHIFHKLNGFKRFTPGFISVPHSFCRLLKC